MDYKQVIVIRKDLHVNFDKMIRCASRASLKAAEMTRQKKPTIYQKWSFQGQKKIAIRVTNIETMNKIINFCNNKGICWSFDKIENNVENGEYSVIGIGPVKSSSIDPVTKKMKLL